MKDTLEVLKAKIDELSDEMEKLVPARDRYFELSFKKGDLDKEYKERIHEKEKGRLVWNTRYIEPEYPRMGSQGNDGYARFENKEDAEKLIELLKRGYYYGYVLVWDGPGEYVVEPSWETDHDNEVIYTATFKRMTE